MFVRLPAGRPVALAALVGLFALSTAIVAQPPAPADVKSPADLRGQQEQNAILFAKFQRELLQLAQKLERSDRPEDKDRAKTIYSALDLAKKENLDTQFQKMIAAMGKGGSNSQEIGAIIGQDAQLTKVLQEIMQILMTDDESARIKAEIAKLEQHIKEAKEIKRNQETIRGITEAQKGEADRLAKAQKDLAERTKDLADRMANKKPGDDKKGEKGGKPGEKPDDKAAPKPEAKPGEQAGEKKPDTKESKSDSKEAQSGSDPKKPDDKGAGKDGKPEDQPGKDSKDGKDAGEARGGEPKEGEPKDPKGGDPKGGDPKKEGDPKGGDPKGGEPKPGDPKGGEPKTGDPKGGESKAGDPKGGEPKAGDPKGGEPKGGDPKGGEPKKADAKPADGKSQGKGKGEDKESKGQKGGEGKGQEPPKGSDQKGQQGAPKPDSGSPPGGSPPPGGAQQPPPPPQQPEAPGRKQIQEAYPHQQGAEQDLKKNDRPAAGKKEDKAIEELAKAIQELEKRLKQLREEEMLKLLANLEARTNRMLAMQIEVYEETKKIHGLVVKNNNQKTVAEVQKSQQQSQKEAEIILEANKTMKLMETEGSAVAFARVLEEVRQDMIAVQKRLDAAVVDQDTQSIEEYIIDMLKQMAAALKKAQQDQQPMPPGPPMPPGQQKPGDQKLIDVIAELKLIRSMQMQVNSRTEMYGKAHPGELNPLVQAELKQLASRQAKLQEMLAKIANGNNQ